MREIGSTKMAKSNLCKIEFYVPETHLEAVKNAMFETGAGKVGAYDSCARCPGKADSDRGYGRVGVIGSWG